MLSAAMNTLAGLRSRCTRFCWWQKLSAEHASVVLGYTRARDELDRLDDEHHRRGGPRPLHGRRRRAHGLAYQFAERRSLTTFSSPEIDD